VPYRINENTSDCTSEGTAVRAAADTWNNVRAVFTFRYAGTHSNREAGQNGYNDIMWSNSLDPGTLAQAVRTFSGGLMREADIEFNDKDWHWSSGSNPGLDEFDIQSILLHELGHWLSLRDLYGDIGDGVNDVGKVMYGRGSPGEMKRNLHRDDIAGIRWIYGASSASLVTGDLNGDSRDDLAGINSSGMTCYTTDLAIWTDIPLLPVSMFG
jgi:hypothetical protein